MSKFGLETFSYFGRGPEESAITIDSENNFVSIGTDNAFGSLNLVGPSGGNTEIFLTDPDVSQTVGNSLIIRQAGSQSYIMNRNSDNLLLGTGNSNRLYIDSTGRVGVGYIGPSYDFDVQKNTSATDVVTRIKNADTDSTSDALLRLEVGGTTQSCYIEFGDSDDANAGYIQYVHSDNSMRFITNAAEDMRLEADGDLHVDGDVIAFSTTISDERLKENITLVDNALEKVNQLRGVTFKYTTDGKISAGVIAQDVEKVLPEAVSDKEIPLKMDDGETYKTVRYDALHALLIEAIKELSAEVKLLKEGK